MDKVQEEENEDEYDEEYDDEYDGEYDDQEESEQEEEEPGPSETAPKLLINPVQKNFSPYATGELIKLNLEEIETSRHLIEK